MTHEHNLAVLRVSGRDATTFLNAQLTVAVSDQSPKPRLSAWCDAKGRTIALFRLFPGRFQSEAGIWYLCLPNDLIEPVSKRLRMFILRSDVQLEDVSADLACVPVTDSNSNDSHLALTPELNESLIQRTAEQAITANPVDLIRNGIPQVVSATSGLWVPQWLNLDQLNAIDFDKGCYPGQEVVAKLRFRGEVKRRLQRIQYTGTPTEPGAVLTDENGKNQGEIVMSTATADNQLCESLAVIRQSDIDSELYINNNIINVI